MPWKCACGVEQLDHVSTCPACGGAKTAWTVVADKTRTLKVASARRLRALRGLGSKPLAAAADYDLAALEPCDQAPVLSFSEAEALQEAGQRPAPSQVLFARVSKKRSAPELGAEVLFVSQPSALSEVEASSRDSRGRWVVPYLLVWGGDVSELSFPGLEVLDVSEDEGHAPTLELSWGEHSLELPLAANVGLRVALCYEDGSPMAEAEYRAVFSDGSESCGSADGEGIAALSLPAGATHARLFLVSFAEDYVSSSGEGQIDYVDGLGDW